MDLHIENILKDLENDDFQAYLLTQFTNVEYISGYKPTSFAFCIIKKIQLSMHQEWIWKSQTRIQQLKLRNMNHMR